jgi:hypothetical protein
MEGCGYHVVVYAGNCGAWKRKVNFVCRMEEVHNTMTRCLPGETVGSVLQNNPRIEETWWVGTYYQKLF